MYRWRLADEPLYPDRFGDFHDDRAQMRDTQPRGGQDEVCPVCLRAVEAREHCATCGDVTDVERDGPGVDRSCPRSEGSSALAGEPAGAGTPPAVAARLAERPEEAA